MNPRSHRPQYSRYMTALIVGVTTLLLVLHTLGVGDVKVDTTSVLLVVILLLVPYLPWVTKIKYGEFEAEIGREEIRKIEKQLETSGQTAAPVPVLPDELEDIHELAQIDPTVALLKIRLALESRLRSLAAIYIQRMVHSERREKQHLSSMVHELKHAGVIDAQLAAAIRDVASVANRAVHGESISSVNLEAIVDLALRVISSLDGIVSSHALATMRSEPIDAAYVADMMMAQYDLKTIVPYGDDSPEQRQYTMNQAELSAWLEQYDEQAEFIISLTARPNNRSKVTKHS